MAHGRIEHYAKEGHSKDDTGAIVLTKYTPFFHKYILLETEKNSNLKYIFLLHFWAFCAIISLEILGRGKLDAG